MDEIDDDLKIQYAADPMLFLSDLVIPGARGAVRFGDVMADFQREWFAAVAPSLAAVACGERPPLGRFWVERTKGASKDSDLACCLLWLLAFTSRPLSCQVGAADQDQADELRKAARDILHLNPWLGGRVKVQSWRLVCDATGATAEIIAADVAGSHGARPDVLILNELSHVTKQEFAENLMDNAAKVPNGLVVIATNAGFTDTWQMRWRELARESGRWYFHKWDRPALWLDEAEIDEAKRRNSQLRYLRLWWGVWASGTGDALDQAIIDAAVDPQAGPLTGFEPYGFCAGLDLGVKFDLSAFVVLGADGATQRLCLADCLAWAPDPATGEVDLELVKAEILSASRRFNGLVVGFDPNQCLFLAQQLRRENVNMVEVPFVGKHLDVMAASLLEVFRSKKITLYPDADLLAELGRLRLVEKPYGYKIEAARTKDGHCDRATALTIAISLASKAMLGGSRTIVLESPICGGGEVIPRYVGPEPSWF